MKDFIEREIDVVMVMFGRGAHHMIRLKARQSGLVSWISMRRVVYVCKVRMKLYPSCSVDGEFINYRSLLLRNAMS